MDACLLWILCVVRQRSLRRANHSSKRVIPTVVRRCVWSRNLVKEEALDHWGLLRQKQTNKTCMKQKFSASGTHPLYPIRHITHGPSSLTLSNEWRTIRSSSEGWNLFTFSCSQNCGILHKFSYIIRVQTADKYHHTMVCLKRGHIPCANTHVLFNKSSKWNGPNGYQI